MGLSASHESRTERESLSNEEVANNNNNNIIIIIIIINFCTVDDTNLKHISQVVIKQERAVLGKWQLPCKQECVVSSSSFRPEAVFFGPVGCNRPS